MITPIAFSLIPPPVAAIVYAAVILGLFYLDQGENTPMSKGFWIPTAWLFIVSSRNISLWLGMIPSSDSAEVYLEGNPLDRALFSGLLLAGLVVVISRIDRVGPILRKNASLLLFLSFCAVSILWSGFAFVALKRWTKEIGDAVMMLIIATEPIPLVALKRLISRLGFILIPLSVLFIKYYPSLGREITTGSYGFTGVTTQKNSLGLICMLYGVVFLWMFRAAYRDRTDPSRRRRLVAYGTILLMIVWLLKTCDSMTSITGLAMAGAVMLFVSRAKFVRRSALVHWLVLAVISLVLFATFLDPWGALLNELGRNPSLTGRTHIWNLVLGIPINPWVGTGFESFWLGSRLEELRSAGYNFPINEAHNGYIEVYLELGWVGVSFIAVLLLTAYKRVIAVLRWDPEMGSLFLGFLLTVMFESVTEAAFRVLTPSWDFLVLVLFATSQVLLSVDGTEIRGGQFDNAEDGEMLEAPQSASLHPVCTF